MWEPFYGMGYRIGRYKRIDMVFREWERIYGAVGLDGHIRKTKFDVMAQSKKLCIVFTSVVSCGRNTTAMSPHLRLQGTQSQLERG